MSTHHLLAYPRSASTWIRYVAEFLTHRPSVGLGEGPLGTHVASITINPKAAPVLLKAHSVGDLVRNAARYRVKPNSLIIVLRNPAELQVGCNIQRANHYLGIVKWFHKLATPKHLFYYEDIFTKPDEFIRKLGKVIGASVVDVEKFIKDLQAHRDHAYEFKKIKQPKRTKLEKTETPSLYRTLDGIPKEQLVKIRTFLTEQCGKPIFDQYLGRYFQ